MSVRARLADALWERRAYGSVIGVQTAVDVLLSLPGIAIVELPDPDYFDHWDIPSCGEFNGFESTGDAVVSVDITEDGIEADTFGEMTPLESRLLAAALLAAANAAEADR